MHHFVRNFLFFLFVTAFIIGAPAIVLYTAGYRYNPVNGHIVRTGVLSVSSVPRGADIILSADATQRKTPYVFNRIMPGEYSVTLDREGYHSFVRNLLVTSGGTTYLSDVLLFLNSTPQLLASLEAEFAVPSIDGTKIGLVVRTDREAQIWRYDVQHDEITMLTQYPAKASDILSLAWSSDGTMLTLSNNALGTEVTFTDEGVTVSTDVDQGTTPAPLKLIPNAQAIEVHDARQLGSPLIALLPLGEYRLAEVDDAYVVLTGGNHAFYLLDLNRTENPIVVSVEASVYDFDSQQNRLAVSDGIELTTYNIATGESHFVTRQSTAIIALAWHPDGDALLVATNDDLRAFALNDNQINVTTLFTEAKILSFSLDENGKNGYFFGEYNETSGVFVLPLTQ